MVEPIVSNNLIQFSALTMNKRILEQTFIVRERADMHSQGLTFIGIINDPHFFLAKNKAGDIVRVPMYSAQTFAPVECVSYNMAIEWVKKQQEVLPHIYIK